jgi:hypothetical protein
MEVADFLSFDTKQNHCAQVLLLYRSPNELEEMRSHECARPELLDYQIGWV